MSIDIIKKIKGTTEAVPSLKHSTPEGEFCPFNTVTSPSLLNVFHARDINPTLCAVTLLQQTHDLGEKSCIHQTLRLDDKFILTITNHNALNFHHLTSFLIELYIKKHMAAICFFTYVQKSFLVAPILDFIPEIPI
ncbi:MAG: hypothetical protein AAB652_02280 [Patescibacteria group bacterium]